MAYLAIKIPEAGITEPGRRGTPGKIVAVEGIGNPLSNRAIASHVRAAQVAKAHGRRKRAAMLLIEPMNGMIHASTISNCIPAASAACWSLSISFFPISYPRLIYFNNAIAANTRTNSSVRRTTTIIPSTISISIYPPFYGPQDTLGTLVTTTRQLHHAHNH